MHFHRASASCFGARLSTRYSGEGDASGSGTSRSMSAYIANDARSVASYVPMTTNVSRIWSSLSSQESMAETRGKARAGERVSSTMRAMCTPNALAEHACSVWASAYVPCWRYGNTDSRSRWAVSFIGAGCDTTRRTRSAALAARSVDTDQASACNSYTSMCRNASSSRAARNGTMPMRSPA